MHEHSTHLVLFPGGEWCTDCGYVSPPSAPGAPYFWWCHRVGGANMETLALVAHHLAEVGDDADQVAYLIEKPWKFTDEFAAAVRACAPPTTHRTLRALDPAGDDFITHGIVGRITVNPHRKDYTEQFTASPDDLRRTLGLPPTD